MPRILTIVLALALASACSDSSGPQILAAGSVSFSYSGGQSGDFTASGAVNSVSAPSSSQQWAFGVREQTAGSIGVIGNRPQAQGLHDYAVIGSNRLTPGSASIDANCDPNQDASCDGVVVLFNASETPDAPGMLLCTLTSGTVTLTTVSDTRATGAFSGTGSCVDHNATESPFTVTNGAFDVALTTMGAPG